MFFMSEYMVLYEMIDMFNFENMKKSDFILIYLLVCSCFIEMLMLMINLSSTYYSYLKCHTSYLLYEEHFN
jgi:hypothetical protein